jgi:hypothetical protein
MRRRQQVPVLHHLLFGDDDRRKVGDWINNNDVTYMNYKLFLEEEEATPWKKKSQLRRSDGTWYESEQQQEEETLTIPLAVEADWNSSNHGHQNLGRVILVLRISPCTLFSCSITIFWQRKKKTGWD